VESKRTILHVDDDPLITQMIGDMLRETGYEVTALHDPCQAVDKLISSNHRVVLLDISMPGIDGLNLLRQIKAHDGGIQVIMLTGIVSIGSVLQSFRWGAEACFFKPLRDKKPLLDALDDVFRKLDRWRGTLEDLSRRKHQDADKLLL
jgi:CheY-like chemotaxis protein